MVFLPLGAILICVCELTRRQPGKYTFSDKALYWSLLSISNGCVAIGIEPIPKSQNGSNNLICAFARARTLTHSNSLTFTYIFFSNISLFCFRIPTFNYNSLTIESVPLFHTLSLIVISSFSLLWFFYLYACVFVCSHSFFQNVWICVIEFDCFPIFSRLLFLKYILCSECMVCG